MFDVKPITSPIKYDCGATCLKMLLAYYNIEVDLETLIKDCNTTYRGCSGGDILRAARKHGLEDIMAWKEKDAPFPPSTPEAKEIDVPTLEEDRPAIVWWKFNHWCVLCGKDDDGKVVICNPDRGRYRMSESLFNSYYSGVSITKGIPEKLPE